METNYIEFGSTQTIGNLTWKIKNNTPTPDNSLNGVVSCIKPAIAGTGKLVASPTKSHMSDM
jgi:hypothetical protein